jgi:hypothetical protein
MTSKFTSTIDVIYVVVYCNKMRFFFYISVHPLPNPPSLAKIHSRTSDNNSKQPRASVGNNAALIHATIGVNIVIRESIAPPINLLLVHESTEPVHRASRLVIPVRLKAAHKRGTTAR